MSSAAQRTIFLSIACKERELGAELTERIQRLGFRVLSALTDSPDDVPLPEMFRNNVELIRQSDIFVAVLSKYGKDLAAEVGMAYAWGMPRIGLDFTALEEDVMVYYALEKIVKPSDLEESLRVYLF